MRAPAPARELFTGERFRKARAYAEESGRPWYVLSAKWALLDPDEVIAPYDVYLGDQPEPYRRAWGEWAVAQLSRPAGDLRGRVEVHAGRAFVDPLRAPLDRAGARLREPLQGLRQGEQLAWYGARPLQPPEREPMPEVDPPAVSTPAEPVTARAADAPRPSSPDSAAAVTSQPTPARPFDYRWPTGVEHFEQSWEVDIVDAGKTHHVRHGLAPRQVYGSRRQHSVTFLDGQPMVEGVAADDCAQRRSLISPLKGADGKMIRLFEDVPAAYAGLPLVDHRLEIDAPYSRDAIAVRLREDDVIGWARYALARAKVRGEQTSVSRPRIIPSPAPLVPPARSSTRADVVAALLAYGRSHRDERPDAEASFTPVPTANRLILDDPFAFLLGVIFDQGIPAERAWRAPYDLRTRLGHLDPARIAHEETAVRVAIGTVPKLHR